MWQQKMPWKVKIPLHIFFLVKVKAQKSFILKIENDFNVVTNTQDILPKPLICICICVKLIQQFKEENQFPILVL
jgi:hypothetical protein